MSEQQFHPVGELDEAGLDNVVIERRDRDRWQGPVADAVDVVLEDGKPVYLVEDGERVAVISPYTGE